MSGSATAGLRECPPRASYIIVTRPCQLSLCSQGIAMPRNLSLPQIHALLSASVRMCDYEEASSLVVRCGGYGTEVVVPLDSQLSYICYSSPVWYPQYSISIA